MESKVFIKRVVIDNFKSIKHLELELNPGLNVLVGPNAGGKTNILEAIHFLYKALVEEAGKNTLCTTLSKILESTRHNLYEVSRE